MTTVNKCRGGMNTWMLFPFMRREYKTPMTTNIVISNNVSCFQGNEWIEENKGTSL